MPRGGRSRSRHQNASRPFAYFSKPFLLGRSLSWQDDARISPSKGIALDGCAHVYRLHRPPCMYPVREQAWRCSAKTFLGRLHSNPLTSSFHHHTFYRQPRSTFNSLLDAAMTRTLTITSDDGDDEERQKVDFRRSSACPVQSAWANGTCAAPINTLKTPKNFRLCPHSLVCDPERMDEGLLEVMISQQ